MLLGGGGGGGRVTRVCVFPSKKSDSCVGVREEASVGCVRVCVACHLGYCRDSNLELSPLARVPLPMAKHRVRVVLCCPC